jgi:hypothetical protein
MTIGNRSWNLFNGMGAAARRSWDDEMKLRMQVLPALYSGATLVLDPMWARNLKELKGFQTRQNIG